MEELLRKRIPDDVVEYYIHLPPLLLKSANINNHLENYLEKCLIYVLNATTDYIWQNESFNLHISSIENVPCLTGATNFGDSVDDEWFLVYLLQKLTHEFPGLIASVHDTDGQFILIEAAEYIPKWLNCDTCRNRVFFADGFLHILSIPSTPGHISFFPVDSPTLSVALDIIAKFACETLASVPIRKCLDERIHGFPQKAFENVHLTNVFIPKDLVYVLDQSPNFISSCVQSFYMRDPIDLRACRAFNFMKPDTRVWCQLPMTRHHYAQLMQQLFTPDKRSGYQKNCDLTAAEHKGVDLGMKIAHGCEIFLSRFKHLPDSSPAALDVYDEQKFLCFIKSLKDIDYFGNELEGSKLYQHLFSQAKIYFLENLDEKVKNSVSVLDHHVLTLLQSASQNDFLLQKLEIAHTFSDLAPEMSDEWMYLDEDDVNQIGEKMNKGFSLLHKNSNQLKSTIDSLESKQLKETIEKVNQFVNEQSDFSGVEVNDDQSIKFDTKDFLTSLGELLQVTPTKNMDLEKSCSDESSDDFLSSDEENKTLSDNMSEEFCEYLECMDSELAETAVGQSFVSKHHNSVFSQNSNVGKSQLRDDVNMLENFMVGKKEEKVSSGPISNILNSMGADLPE